MPRLLFEKKGQAVWISHLDLMRLFQRAFKRAGLPLKHTQGFNPRPSVSIALPMSVGIQSRCELLDFDLDGAEVPNDEIRERLNQALIAGVDVLDVYDKGRKIRDLALLECQLTMVYDNGIPEDGEQKLRNLFASESLVVEKKNKNGITDQDIIPMIRKLEISRKDDRTILLHGLVCCQNPTLNPMQMPAAIEKYLPEMRPDFVKCGRVEIYDKDETIFR